ncbi:unnamed protein product [Didymodactylos carnosus]|uniref:Tyrosine-protein kinase ephrin type A/B receptor-like domain-containing protein n=1 Tax=Didymodactylos carnosus TaxID=1234261 RepID=A0A815HHZ5_9BILA|nr:unnamed protein product [Didymodactylos carnosus]CAF4223980.1 unnamed protein product [Didymodactylos carnosus]
MFLFFVLPLCITVAFTNPSCTPGFYLSGTQCRKCQIGSYCPDGQTQLTCPPGSYTDLYEQSQCRLCRPGWYQFKSGSTVCLRCGLGCSCANSTQLPEQCDVGTYADLYGQTQCRQCRKGYYNVKKGATYCTKCPLGHECANSKVAPIPCPIGFYNALYEQTKCRPCIKGSTTQTVGQTACINVVG